MESTEDDADEQVKRDAILKKKIENLSAKERVLLHELEHDALKVGKDLENIGTHFLSSIINFIVDICFNAPGLLLTLLIIGVLWFVVTDGILELIVLMREVMLTLLDLINKASSVANSATGGISNIIDDVSGSSVRIDKIPQLTPSEVYGPVYTTMKNLPRVCFAMDTWQKVIMVFAPYVMSRRVPKLCYFKRWIYPVRWFYHMVNYFTFWLTYDAAPYPGDNCGPAHDSIKCMWFRMWLPILELAVPSIPIYYFVKDFGYIIYLIIAVQLKLLSMLITVVYYFFDSLQLHGDELLEWFEIKHRLG